MRISANLVHTITFNSFTLFSVLGGRMSIFVAELHQRDGRQEQRNILGNLTGMVKTTPVCVIPYDI